MSKSAMVGVPASKRARRTTEENDSWGDSFARLSRSYASISSVIVFLAICNIIHERSLRDNFLHKVYGEVRQDCLSLRLQPGERGGAGLNGGEQRWSPVRRRRTGLHRKRNVSSNYNFPIV